MENKDWLLLTVSAAEGSTLSPVQLQKAIFLLNEKIKPAVGESFYAFVPYNYGPFSSHIYSDAEELEEAGLLHIDRNGYKKYSVTPAGKTAAEQMARELPQPIASFVHQVVEWVRSLSFKQLCKAIYAEYPKYTENSVFRF